MEIPVKVVNQGFMSALLEARLVNVVPGLEVELSSGPLSGAREEYRTPRVRQEKSDPTDITVAFHARNEIPDLGGRDRIHFVCAVTRISHDQMSEQWQAT